MLPGSHRYFGFHQEDGAFLEYYALFQILSHTAFQKFGIGPLSPARVSL
jgi:hypothetical protein